MFEVKIENIEELKVLFLGHEKFKVPTPYLVKRLREELYKEGLYRKSYVGLTNGNLCLLAAPDCDLEKNETFLNKIKAFLKEGMTDIIRELSRYDSRSKFKIYYVIARSLEQYIARSLFKQGFTIIRGGKFFTDKHPNLVIGEDVLHEIQNYVKMYRGFKLECYPIVMEDVTRKKSLSLGIAIDPAIVIQPIMTLYDIMKYIGVENYPTREALKKEEKNIPFEEYSIVYYENWEIREFMVNEAKAKVFRFRKEKGKYLPIESEYALSDLYPPRRPEILDEIIEHMHPELRGKNRITTLLKIESHHFFEDESGKLKKDYMASRKRFQLTVGILYDILNKELKESREKYLNYFNVEISKNRIISIMPT